MLSNIALDVSIGLTFIFLLYSLLATIIQEIVAQWLSLRSSMLIKGIRNMLEDRETGDADGPESSTLPSFLSSAVKRLLTALGNNWKHYRCPLPSNTVTKAFYKHPGIKYLSESVWNSKPAYIPAASFATAMIQLLRGYDHEDLASQMDKIKETLFEKKAIELNGVTYAFDEETLKHVQQLYRDSLQNVNKFRELLENWYNGTMDRVNGWYKKQTQLILFIIGFIIAVIFNADAITFTKILSRDKAAREDLVQLAISSQSKYDTLVKQVSTIRKERLQEDTVVVQVVNPELKEAYQRTLDDIDNANAILGLGYGDGKCPQLHPLQKSGFLAFTGWLLTALAISLGAPFWFDILNKVVKLRIAGQKPPADNTKASS